MGGHRFLPSSQPVMSALEARVRSDAVITPEGENCRRAEVASTFRVTLQLPPIQPSPEL
jgi:hypothetical protein